MEIGITTNNFELAAIFERKDVQKAMQISIAIVDFCNALDELE